MALARFFPTPAGQIVALLLGLIFILISVFTFGGDTASITSSTATLKIDTRKASVNDLIGGIELYPASSGSSTITASTWSTAFAASTTSTSQTAVATRAYEQARSSLENVTDVLENIESYVTAEDFNLARVFGVHDHLYLSTDGFRCWSENNSSGGWLTANSVAHNGCPSNGFFKCFGKSSSISVNSANPYLVINTAYLLASTSLNETIVSDLYINWLDVRDAANPDTLKINLPTEAYKSMSKLLCGNDYIYSSYRGGTSQIKLSKTYVLGITSLIFTALSLISFSAWRLKLITWFISFVLFIAMFALAFASNIPAAKYINKSDGITAKASQGGLVAYFFIILILHLLISVILTINFTVRGFSPKRNKADTSDLSSSSSDNNDPPNYHVDNELNHHIELENLRTTPAVLESNAPVGANITTDADNVSPPPPPYRASGTE